MRTMPVKSPTSMMFIRKKYRLLFEGVLQYVWNKVHIPHLLMYKLKDTFILTFLLCSICLFFNFTIWSHATKLRALFNFTCHENYTFLAVVCSVLSVFQNIYIVYKKKEKWGGNVLLLRKHKQKNKGMRWSWFKRPLT